MPEFDYALVGGGLQNGLLALALRHRQPAARIVLLEREGSLGGNHTWCFHAGDLGGPMPAWLEPLVVHRWPGYRVRFPSYERTLSGQYSAITSSRLHTVVSDAVGGSRGGKLLLETEVSSVHPDRVLLASGEALDATVVVDARGPARPRADAPAGYQKFLGLELELDEPHRLETPMLMDACVDQSEGYRFVYVLPLGPTRLLVEDTYFHESPELDRERLHGYVTSYVERQGWRHGGIVREEAGVLPMPWRGSRRRPGSGPLLAGYRGGWFHPGTGYSLPVAFRLAEFVAAEHPERLFGRALSGFAARHRRQARFAQLLNRFLFRWFAPSHRIAVFERFYRLPETTIGNFYALRLTSADRLRLVAGRPPRGLSLRYRLGLGTD